ncbi:monovalent cation:proton antiporter-2 (CPA2) family protein [Actinobacillus pleuropneumoniae]|uniref:monovalent cation:proton antiporter-2 (CPA2) family protein n=1 Tax=Actinobacillus pleuropneumoniae TaxID=715 RepID=UPI003D025AA5
MAAEGASQLTSVVALLGAAIIAVPIFKRIGLGSVLGYLAGGLAIGPFGFGLFSDPHTILHVAELGVVMFLFLVGLEMQPAHLWGLRKYIFGLGSFQVIGAAIALTGLVMAFGYSWQVAFVSAAGFVLTSTAIVMQVLSERGEMTSDRGRKMVSILLFEDMLIVPLLAVVAFLSPIHSSETASTPIWQKIAIAVFAMVFLFIIGTKVLNPFFKMLARTKIREMMTAVALFVVLGSALLMEVSGLSAAMGAFAAGVLLSTSSFRHQLEVDIDPFKGLLLGLFFLAVGMSLDLNVVWDNLGLILSGVALMMLIKGGVIFLVARLSGSNKLDAHDRAIVMAQGGEFAFVLFAAAHAQKVIDDTVHANMTAIVVLSIVFTPLMIIVSQKFIVPRLQKIDEIKPHDHIEEQNPIILVGLGRFGQVVNHLLQMTGYHPTIIELNPKLIAAMKKRGVKSYYGNGAHPDLLKAAGIQTAQMLIVAIDNPKQTLEIVKYARSVNPHIKIIARAYDRYHVYDLVQSGADIEVRETFDGALRTGKQALRELGLDADKVHEIGNMYFGKDRHSVKLMSEVYDPKIERFKNEEMYRIALEQDQEIMAEIQKILARE